MFLIYLKKIIYIFISLIVLFLFSYAGIKLLNDRGKENISWAVVYIKERQAYFNSNKFNVEEFDTRCTWKFIQRRNKETSQ